VADPDEKRKKDWEAQFGGPYPTAPTPTPVEPLAPVTYEPSPFARPAQTRPPFNQAEWEKTFGPLENFLPTTPSGVTTAIPPAAPPMPTAAPPGAPGQQPKSSFWDFFDPVVDPVVSGFESALGGIKAVPGMVMESFEAQPEGQLVRGLGAGGDIGAGGGEIGPAFGKYIAEPAGTFETGLFQAAGVAGTTVPEMHAPGSDAAKEQTQEAIASTTVAKIAGGELGFGEGWEQLKEDLHELTWWQQVLMGLGSPINVAPIGSMFAVGSRITNIGAKQRFFAAGIKHFVNEAGLAGAQADDASEIILLLAKKKNMTGATFESEANRIIQGMKDAAAASPAPTARTVPRALPGKVVITREEMLAREAVERPGYVDVGDVDPVAQKLADLNAKAGPGDVKFAYFDPDTEEFTITLLKEEVADGAAKAGLGERLLNDNEVFVTSYRAQIKKAAADAASEPVVVASDIPEDAPPSNWLVPNNPSDAAKEIQATEERILELNSQVDFGVNIDADVSKFIGNTWAVSNRWRNLFDEIDNDGNPLATTLARFFDDAPKGRGVGVQDIVDWAQRRFPGSFTGRMPRRVSRVKYDVLDELASGWNEMYRLGAWADAQEKVNLEDVLNQIRALWKQIDGVAASRVQIEINQRRLDMLNNSPAGQALKEQAEVAARQLDAEELEALVDNSTKMVRYLRDMVAVEMGERPGFLAEEFLTRFDKTVDDLMELSFDAADSESTNVLLNVQSLDDARLLEGLDSMLADLGTTAQVRLEDLPAEVPAVTQQIAPGSTDPSEIWPAYNKELEAYVQRRFVAEQEFYASFPYTQQVNKINPRRNHLDRLIKVLENRIAAEGGIRMVSANDIRRIGDDLLDEIRSQPVGQERVPSLIDLSTLREVAPPKVGSHRAYHGTISTFDAFRHGASADNSLYGPGVYLTDDPNIATGYAKGSFRIQRQMGGPQHGQPINDAGEIISEQEAYELAQGAPQIWSVDVEMVKFFDIDAAPDPEIMALIREDEYAWADGFDYANLDLEDIKTNHDLYQVLHGQFGNKWEVNDWLAFRGFDTITHVGGGRTGNLPHRVYIALSDPYVGEEITSVSPRFGPPKAVKVIEALPPAPERPALPAAPTEAAPAPAAGRTVNEMMRGIEATKVAMEAKEIGPGQAPVSYVKDIQALDDGGLNFFYLRIAGDPPFSATADESSQYVSDVFGAILETEYRRRGLNVPAVKPSWRFPPGQGAFRSGTPAPTGTVGPLERSNASASFSWIKSQGEELGPGEYVQIPEEHYLPVAVMELLNDTRPRVNSGVNKLRDLRAYDAELTNDVVDVTKRGRAALAEAGVPTEKGTNSVYQKGVGGFSVQSPAYVEHLINAMPDGNARNFAQNVRQANIVVQVAYEKLVNRVYSFTRRLDNAPTKTELDAQAADLRESIDVLELLARLGPDHPVAGRKGGYPFHGDAVDRSKYAEELHGSLGAAAPTEAAPAPGTVLKVGDKQSVGPRGSMTTVRAVETVDPNVRYELYIADEGQPDHMIRVVDGDTGEVVSAKIYPAKRWFPQRVTDEFNSELVAARRAAGEAAPTEAGRLPGEGEARQEPITVYTGADEPFTEFDVGRIGQRAGASGKPLSDPGFFGRGAYTTTDYEKASKWSYGSGNVMATVIPPDARFLRVAGVSELYDKWGLRALTEKEIDLAQTLRDPQGRPTVESQAAYKESIDTWTDKMIKEGYDGVEYAVPGGDNQFILFHPEKYQFEPTAAPAPAPQPGITMAPRTAVQTGLEGFDVPGQQAEMIMGGTDVAKPEGLINPEELARRNEVVQQVNDGQMALDEGSLSEVMKANAGQHVDGPLRFDPNRQGPGDGFFVNGVELKVGDLVTDGASVFKIRRRDITTTQVGSEQRIEAILYLDELSPSGNPDEILRRSIPYGLNPEYPSYVGDIYRHDSSKPIGGGGSSGWGKNLSDGAGGEKPNKPREMGPDGADPQAPPVPPESKNRIKRLYSSPGNDGGIYLADPRTLQQMVDEGTDADELTQWMFRNIPGLWRMNPSVARQSPVERLVMGLFRSQVADDAYIDVAITMAYDAHASVWTGKMDLPINWKTGQWTHGKWDEATQGPRPQWYDVWSMRRTDKYKGLLTEEHNRLITDFIFVIDEEVERIRLLFGLAPRQKTRGFNEDYIPRKASTWREKVAGGERKVEFEKPSNPNMPRLDLTATEIWQRFNVDFLVDPRAVLELHIRQALREIRMKEFNDALEEMGAVVGYKDILAATHPQLIRLRAAKYGEWSASRKAVKAAIRALNGEELQTRIGKIMADITQEHNLDGVLSKLQIEERLEREPIRAELASEIARLKEAERTARDEWYAVRKLYAEAVEKVKKAEKVKLRGDGVHLFGGMLQEGDVAITANQFKNKFMLTADFKSVQEVITYMTPGGADANILLKLLFEKPANIARTTMSTIDLVLPFTHLLPLFGENPLKWAQGVSIHYASWFAPGLQSRLVRQNLSDYWDLATNGVSVGDPEIFAMMTPGQGINIDEVFKKYQSARPAMGEKEEKLYEYFRDAQHLTRQGMVLTVGRAQSAYQGALGYGRVLLKQAVEESWDGSEDEMYSHIRNMTGALDSRRLGVSANQRAVESMWMGFSPRLLRSTIAVTQSAANWVLKAPTGVIGRNVPVERVPVVGDVASRALGTGATAQQRRAFLALARLATYMSSIYILTGMALGKDWEKDIKPGLNPLNGRRFLSYYMNGSYYGVGGQLRALTQFTFSLYGAASGKRGEWQDIFSLNIHKNPFWFFYASRGALGLTFGGAVAEAVSSETGIGELDILPFDDIEGFGDLWDWGKTAWWPFSAQAAVEAGTWTAGAWSGIVGNVTTNPRDRAIAYITRDSAIEQNVWSEAPPYLRALANELVMTGTDFEDSEMIRRKKLIQLAKIEFDPKYDDWDDIEVEAGAERRWLSKDIDFGPSDLDSSDPNKKALAEYYELYSNSRFVSKDGIIRPDTIGSGWTWLFNAQQLKMSTWTDEQRLHVLASTNLRPVPYELVHYHFPNHKKSLMIKQSQAARRQLLTDAGHPEIAVLQENIFYMQPLTESLSPEMAEFIKNMPPKIGFEKSEEVYSHLDDPVPVGAP